MVADRSLPEPEEALTKAQRVSHLREGDRRRRLTQVAAAPRRSIDRPKVSALLSGRRTNVGSDRLMRLLTALGQDGEIMVPAKPRNQAHGCVRGRGEAQA